MIIVVRNKNSIQGTVIVTNVFTSSSAAMHVSTLARLSRPLRPLSASPCICVRIYIYIEREREITEIERERD